MEELQDFWASLGRHLTNAFQSSVFILEGLGEIIYPVGSLGAEELSPPVQALIEIQQQVNSAELPDNHCVILREHSLTGKLFVLGFGLTEQSIWVIVGPWESLATTESEPDEPTDGSISILQVNGLKTLSTVPSIHSTTSTPILRDIPARITAEFTSAVIEWSNNVMSKPWSFSEVEEILLRMLSRTAAAPAAWRAVPTEHGKMFSICRAIGRQLKDDEKDRFLLDTVFQESLASAVTSASVTTYAISTQTRSDIPQLADIQLLAFVPLSVGVKQLGVAVLFLHNSGPISRSSTAYVSAAATALAPFLFLAEGQEYFNQLLTDVSKTLIALSEGSFSLEAVLCLIAREARRIINAGNCTIWVPDDTGSRIVVRGASETSRYATELGRTAYENLHSANRLNVGVTGYIGLTGKTVRQDDVQDHFCHQGGIHPDWTGATRSYLGVGFRVPHSALFGVLRMESTDADPLRGASTFSTQAEQLAEGIARLLEICCSFSTIRQARDWLENVELVRLTRAKEHAQAVEQLATNLRDRLSQLLAEPEGAIAKLLSWATEEIMYVTRAKCVAIYKWMDQSLTLQDHAEASEYRGRKDTDLPGTIQEGPTLAWHAVTRRKTISGEFNRTATARFGSIFINERSRYGIAAPILVGRELYGALIIETDHDKRRESDAQMHLHVSAGQPDESLITNLAKLLGSTLQNLLQQSELWSSREYMRRQSEMLKSVEAILQADVHDAVGNTMYSGISVIEEVGSALKEAGSDEVAGRVAFAVSLLKDASENIRAALQTAIDTIFVSRGPTPGFIDETDCRATRGTTLRSAVDTALDFAEPLPTNVHCTVAEFPNVPRIAVDHSMLVILFKELLRNAVKAIERCGRSHRGCIHISAETDDTSVIVKIRDNGCGMTEEQRADFCNGCIQGGNNERRGVGAQLVQMIVHRYGLPLKIDSTTDINHRGSIFAVGFPKRLWRGNNNG